MEYLSPEWVGIYAWAFIALMLVVLAVWVVWIAR